MTRNNRLVGEDYLTAYVDGELPEDRRAVVKDWLAQRPDVAARIEADIRISRMLRDGLAPLAGDALPGRFWVEEIRRGLHRRRMSLVTRLAASIALVDAGGVIGWTMKDAGQPNMKTQTVAAAVSAHRIFAVDKRHPVEVSAEAKDHLGARFGNRIGRPAPIPDLSGQGLSLTGGRLLPGPDGPAGQVIYEAETGQHVTLYLRAGAGDESAFSLVDVEGVEALAWRSPDLAYVLTGPVGREGLIRIAHEIQPTPDQ